MTLVVARLRSKAGVPFEHASWCRVPVEWTEIGVHESDLPALVRHPWIECELPGRSLDDIPMPGNAFQLSVRVRTHAALELRVGVETFDRSVRIVRVATEAAIARLLSERNLDVRENDPRLYPATVFAKIRARANVTVVPNAYSTSWFAYALSFDEFSLARFDARLEVELLEPAAMPSLQRVRVRSRTGKPFMRFGQYLQPDRWTELDLYPREIEQILCQDHLEYEACPLPEEEPPSAASGPGAPATIDTPLAEAPVTASAEPLVQASAPIAFGDARTFVVCGALQPIDLVKAWAMRADVHQRGLAQDGFTLDEVLREALQDVPIPSPERAFAMQVAALLARLGWEHLPLRRRSGARVRPYAPPKR